MLNSQPHLNLVFQALSDPTRRAIVERLGRGPGSVSQLAQPFAMSLPAVLQHVAVLEASEPGADRSSGYKARYHDIVPDERIVFTYDLSLGGSLVSVSLATVEFHPGDGGTGTQLTYTELVAFLDGLDDPELRKNGTGGMLDELGHWLERQAATARS